MTTQDTRNKGGRRAADGARDLKQTAVRLTPAQRHTLASLGGSMWIRRALDEAAAEIALQSVMPTRDPSVRVPISLSS